jgi:hypothetical protein
MNFFEISDDILEKHVRIVLNSNFGSDDVFETTDYYNIRCNVSGDSTHDKYKKRGFILKSRSKWVYYCHNCNVSTTVVKWMKEYFPANYKSMMMEIMMNNKKSYNDKYDFKKKTGANERDEEEDTKGFKKITLFPDCVEYCESRKIPKDIYTKWYYAIDGVYKGRIIITFIKNKNNKVYYYQGRSFNNKKGVKYLSRFGEHIGIYNYYNVNVNEPVVLLEGPIDSCFVENSIAVTGLKLKGDVLDKFPTLYFLLDNDSSGRKKAQKLLLEKKYVFNWIKFLDKYKCDGDVKDVNDFILKNHDNISKLTWDIIGEFFTNNNVDKLFFIEGDK